MYSFVIIPPNSYVKLLPIDGQVRNKLNSDQYNDTMLKYVYKLVSRIRIFLVPSFTGINDIDILLNKSITT